ncbi:MAG: hypothetical protein IJT49_02375 [Clostridia bacterium]|nr:hypothetical protein [Clostridia bacterium]
MTELSEKLKEIYGKYTEQGSGERKRSLSELVKGWFSGKGKETMPVDKEFMEIVTEYAGRIVKEGDREDSLTAAELILGMPKTKKFSEQDLCFAAMHSNVAQFIPLFTDDDVKAVREMTQKVPKQYRFPVYKDLVKALDERLKAD